MHERIEVYENLDESFRFRHFDEVNVSDAVRRIVQTVTQQSPHPHVVQA